MHSSRLEISRAALQHNYRVLRATAANRHLMPVVKADAYGLGLRHVLPILLDMPEPPSCLCVATVGEAYELRQLLWHGEILQLGAQQPSDLPQLRALRTRPWVMSMPVLEALLRSDPSHMDLDFDFGMGRMGLRPDQWPELYRMLRAYRGTVGLGTHHPNADRSDLHSARDLTARWQQFLVSMDLHVTARHSANTAAALNQLSAADDTHLRCGIGLYGVDPRPTVDSPLLPAVRLLGRVVQYRTVRAGESLSYGHEFTAPRAMTVAVVTAGYADGLPIAGASSVPVYLGDYSTRIVGRVTMDTVLLDATDMPDESRSGWATLIGGPRGTVRDWATASGRSPYEILTGLGHRPARAVVP